MSAAERPDAGRTADQAPGGARPAARGAANRVAEVQAQARPTLVVAGAFVLAAGVAAALPARTGTWLPLHLFLVGGVLSAISAATQLLAVTWSAAPAPRPAAASLQRWVLAAGAAVLALSRERQLPRLVTVLAGTAVVLALVGLGALLVQIRRGAVVPRFRAAIDGYLVALGLGVVGGGAGIALAADGAGRAYGELRSLHVTVNLFGLVGIVVAATLPFFAAVQARTKQSNRATPAAVRALVAVLATCVAASVAGHLLDLRPLVAGGLAAYAAGVLASVALLPPLGRKQLRWAGPRLLQLVAGLWWWAVAAVLLAVSEAGGDGTTRAVLVLVVGGYGQILSASLAYFGPVLRGGGHVALTAGFAATRSWVALVAANVAALAAALDLRTVVVAAVLVWVADAAVRGVRLAVARQ